MFDAERLLSGLVGGEFTGRRRRQKRYRYHGGGLGGAVGRAALSPQGLTILGGLAIAAYEHMKAKKQAAGATPAPTSTAAPPPFPSSPVPPPPPPAASPGVGFPAPQSPPPPPGASGAPAPAPVSDVSLDPQARALLLIEAMVHAAKADGRIDDGERARILEHLERQGEDSEARDYLETLMSGPTEIERFASRVHDPQLAAEVYAASLLAIDPDTPAEQAYLATLCARLDLDPRMARALELRLEGREEEAQS